MKGILPSILTSFLKEKKSPTGRKRYAASAGQCHVFVFVLALQGELPEDNRADTIEPELTTPESIWT